MLEARFADDARSVRGRIACADGTEVSDFALYPAVLGTPRGLDDVSRPWVYPDGFDAGWIRVDGDRVRDPWITERAGLEFETSVPRRVGALGHHEGTTYAVAGWHPMLGEREAARVPWIRIDYRISVPARFVAWVAGDPSPAGTRRTLKGTHEGRSVPVVLAPHLRAHPTAAGPYLVPEPRHFERRAAEPNWNLRDLDEARSPHAREKLREALAIGKDAAARFALPVQAPLTVIRAPLRERFVAPFDGGFLLSDRAFHLLDSGLLNGFHQLALWRAQLAAYALRVTVPREDRLDPWLVADAVGATIRDLLEVERFGGKESADELLDRFAVIPEIDALQFAPQIPLVDALYEAIDEEPSARSHPDDFFHDRPRGKLLFEKLVDRIGVASLRDAARLYASSNERWLPLVAEIANAPRVSEWIAPYLGPYPSLDYALGEIESGAGTIRVEVRQLGPSEAVEPVEVEIIDANGERHRARRMGPGELSVDAPGPPERVRIDPEGRLVERSTVYGTLAQHNNETPTRWRFLLNNITGLVAVTGQGLALSSSFTLRQIYDQRYRFGLVVAAADQRNAGGFTGGVAVSASYRFGSLLTPLRLSSGVSTAAGFERLGAEAFGDGSIAEPVNQLSWSVGYQYDDRLSPYYSFEGRGLSLSATALASQPDSGGTDLATRVSAAAFYILPLGFHQGLLGRLRYNGIFGEAPAQGQLRLGGRNLGGRGYETFEVRGDTRAIASLEWRHALAVAQRLDILGLLMWTRLEGAAFADAIWMPDAQFRAPDASCSRDVFYDVGYGLRFIGDVLNVSPAAFTVDFGFPLNRCALDDDRLPYTVYVGFLQSFTPF